MFVFIHQGDVHQSSFKVGTAVHSCNPQNLGGGGGKRSGLEARLCYIRPFLF